MVLRQRQNKQASTGAKTKVKQTTSTGAKTKVKQTASTGAKTKAKYTNKHGGRIDGESGLNHSNSEDSWEQKALDGSARLVLERMKKTYFLGYF